MNCVGGLQSFCTFSELWDRQAVYKTGAIEYHWTGLYSPVVWVLSRQDAGTETERYLLNPIAESQGI